MADTRYLKKRREGWYFQMPVPADLQDRVGRKVIIKTLSTRDLSAAQRKRWPLVSETKESFERLRGDISLTAAEIQAEASVFFRSILADAEEASSKGEPEYGTGSPGEEHEGLDAVISLLIDDLYSPDYSRVSGAIESVQKRTGAQLEPGSPSHGELARALLRAWISALRARLAILSGDKPEIPEAFGDKAFDPVTLGPISPRSGKADSGEPFSTVAKAYIEELQRDPTAKLTEQTQSQHEAAFRLFKDFTNDAPLTAITRAQASSFLDTIATLNPNWGRYPGTKKKPLKELLDQFSSDEGLSNRTLNRYAASLGGVFKWAKKRGRFSGENPFEGQSRPEGTQSYVPFTVDELNALFSAPLFSAMNRNERIKPQRHTIDTTMAWVPLIALYTGMRSGEICQLRPDDVRKEGNVWYFNVSEEGDGQSVKTEASIRRVPVHSKLIAAGFLKYVDYVKKSEATQLWPALKPKKADGKLNDYFGKAFVRFRRKQGVDRRGIAFHSFRKCVGTALERARVPESEAVQVLGHDKLSMSYSIYSLGLTLRQLAEIVERIEYPGLRLGPIGARSASH